MMRQPTLQGVAAEVVRLPARWALPDLESCSVDQLVAMAYTAAMDPGRYEELIASTDHVQALIGLLLRFDAQLSTERQLRPSLEALVSDLARSLRETREVVRVLIEQADRRTTPRAETERDVPPAMEHFDEGDL